MIERMVIQGMVYLLDIENRLAAKAKNMSIDSNQFAAIFNFLNDFLYFFVYSASCYILLFFLNRMVIVSALISLLLKSMLSECGSLLLCKERL